MFAPQDIVIDEDGENIELTFFKESPDNFAVFVDKNQHHSYWELWGSSYDWPNQFVRLQFDLLIQQEKFATAQIFLQDYLKRQLITANLYNQLCNFIQSNL